MKREGPARARMSPREHDEKRRAAAVRGVLLRLWDGHHLARHGKARQGKPRAALPLAVAGQLAVASDVGPLADGPG